MVSPRNKVPHRRLQSNLHLKKALIVALTCWALVSTVGAMAAAISAHNDTLAVAKGTKALKNSNAAFRRSTAALAAIQYNLARQHIQIEDACKRLNVQRAIANIAYSSQYKIDIISLNAAITQRPRHQSKQRRLLVRQFLAVERATIHSIRWVPLTNCVSVVALKGAAYKVPDSIRFSERFPSSSQLDAKNAALPSPTDSVP